MMIPHDGSLYATLRAVRSHLVVLVKRLPDVHPSGYINPTSSVARDLQAAEFVYIGRRCTIPPLVSIARYTMLAPGVAIVGDDHNWDEPSVPIQFGGRPPQRRTRIGADVWIGQSAIIMRGLTVGDGAVIAAGSVVTKSVPEREIWAGVPARKLRDRFDSLQAQQQHADMLRGPLAQARFAHPLSEVAT